ncbi:MAG: hypothetical protein ACOVQ2_00330 [Flavobacterium sp.]
MNTSALIFMVVSIAIVTIITFYFFYKALTTPQKEDKNIED